MSTMNYSCDSLYNLSLNQLKYLSTNENILQHVLKFNIPSFLMDIIWKILCVNNENPEFVNDDTLQNYNPNSINRGRKLTQLTKTPTELFSLVVQTRENNEYIESFANTQQTEFNGNFQVIDRFTLGIFFKLMKATQQRDQLFTIFQICIQHKGLEFPQQLAEEWLNTIQNAEDVINNIEQGQELGIFLCDAGWYKESAKVLSCTYKILCTKLECIDQNLKIVKIVQCLTKLLLALSNYYNINEAKLVFKYLIKNVKILQNKEEGELCVAYAYFAISKYHELLMEFNKAWLWAMKAINKLQNKNDDKLKLLVIGHAINIAGKDKKSIIQYNFVTELHAYNKNIEPHIFNELLSNQVRQLLEEKEEYSFANDFYCSLDMTRNLYGYYNLNTANQFLKYAEYGFYHSDLVIIIIDAMNCVIQALYIMDKLGIPEDNMSVVKAQLLKSILLQKYIAFRRHSILERNIMLFEAGILQINALKISIRTIGKNTQYTANIYCYLGLHFKLQKQYEQSTCMFLEAIQIRSSILGHDTPLVAQCLISLGDLYAHDLDNFEEAEQYYLRALNIYENSCEEYYPDVLSNLSRLVFLIQFITDMDRHIEYRAKQLTFERRYNNWKIQTHTEFDENHTNSCIHLEKFRHILSNHYTYLI